MPHKKNLFINYYTTEHNHIERNNEIIFCLNKNILLLEKNLISSIYLLINKHEDVSAFKNINNLYTEEIDVLRPTFDNFFSLINKISSQDDINIIINADIILTESIILVDSFNMEKTFLALTRWEIDKNGSIDFLNRADSQDVWIFKGTVKINCDYSLGVIGCDNKIAYDFYSSGYRVINPSIDIKCLHLHNASYRNYMGDRLPGPYHHIAPTKI